MGAGASHARLVTDHKLLHNLTKAANLKPSPEYPNKLLQIIHQGRCSNLSQTPRVFGPSTHRPSVGPSTRSLK